MRNVPLGDLGTFKNGVNFTSDSMGRGLPVVNVKDITNYHRIDPKNLDLVDIQVQEEYLAKDNDIFFVRSSVKRDGVGLVGILKKIEAPLTHCGFVIRFRPSSKEINSIYLLYLLKSHNYREILKGLSSGATIVNISQTSLKNIVIPLPDIKKQENIASILSTFDDLIENNLRRIKLLEEAANTRYLMLLVENKLTEQNIEELCTVCGGGTPSTKESSYWDNGDISWFTPTDLTKHNTFVLLDSEKKITSEGLKKSSAKLVPPKTILMTSRATIGFFGMIDKEVCTNQGFINILPKAEYLRMYLLFNLMNRKEEIIGHANGSTYKEINKSNFKKLTVFLPIKDKLQEFENYCEPIYSQIRCILLQNKNLKEARDILLPRLMSGQIEI